LKHFYLKHVCLYWRWAFPKLVSYNRFVELIPQTLLALTAYLSRHLGKSSGIAFMDSTAIAVCENRRIPSHRVFTGIAKRTKTSVGWVYGFKLHLVVNTDGELLAFRFTAANVDDRRPVAGVTHHLCGKIYADKGYISKTLAATLKTRGIYLVTKVRKDMKPQELSDFDAVMLKKRRIIESVIGQLKHQSQLQHTRHRSLVNFQVNAVCALIAYTYQEKKPSVNLRALDAKKDSLVPVN
jgi:hypothetical protein